MAGRRVNPKVGAGAKPRLLPMAELQNRPCEVDGRPALFHRWVEDDRALLNINAYVSTPTVHKLVGIFRDEHIVPSGCSIDVLRETFALVEYRDGTVAKVDPLLVRFVVEEVGHEG